ncbi:hypothetical protein ACX9R5_00455 [Rathayibacter sp. CAU 1779]
MSERDAEPSDGDAEPSDEDARVSESAAGVGESAAGQSDRGAGLNDAEAAHGGMSGDAGSRIDAERQDGVPPRYGTAGHGSPRTPESPRTFTLQEFIGGAARAWLWFQLFGATTSLLIGLVVCAIDPTEFALLPMFLFVGALSGIPTSVGAAIVFSPFAYGLGRRLQHIGRDRVHVVAFTVFGLGAGVLTALLFGLGWGLVTGVAPWYFGLSVFTCAYAPASAVAVPLGWWGASRRALREDEERSAWAAVSFVSTTPDGVKPEDDDGSE